jgi:hypothetical protein
MIASVAAHWAHKAKKTMTDRATGILNTGRSVPSQVAPAAFRFSSGDSSAMPFAQVVDHPERADDHLAGRERRDRRAAELPIPAERADNRLDRFAHAAQKAVFEVQAGDAAFGGGELVAQCGHFRRRLGVFRRGRGFL